ncbi:S8 family serine peptidase [Deinococcus roseus]|uniref:Peptidase S8 n=1 Tax=Deinococcus roseus TaxID=392414 RepID=A0ABQ2D2G2_9DEIO|nr:S8 family serine peptidase [Deinococcus roseus]GGJ38156.1 hypothetical protein GCM10008938_25360 [Deinococcus roseus]
MSKKFFSSLTLITATIILAGCSGGTIPTQKSLPAPHAPQTSQPTTKTLQSQTRWMVEFETQGVGIQRLSVQSFSKLAADQNIQYQQNYAYSRVFNGVSVTTTRGNIERLAALPGVKAVYRVGQISLPKDVPAAAPSPALTTALAQTGADIAQNEMGLSGKGIKVGIIDTGIDIDHPDLKDHIIVQHDFVGDNYGKPGNYVPKPDNIADDCNGHGTHVAGIVGAHGTVTGVAPQASLGAYRVFGCEGSTYDDIIIAALEQAVADKMDVVNMSLGSFGTWAGGLRSEVFKKAADAGTIVVVSGGNEGKEGPFATGNNAADQNTIAAVSYEATMLNLNYFTANGVDVGFIKGSASAPVPTTGTLPLTRTGTATTTNDACSPLPAGSLTGKAVLIRRGTCAFTVKAQNAQAAGAAAVVIYNNTAGYISPSVVADIPVVSIEKSAGEALDAKLAAAEAVTITWKSDIKSFPNPVGGLPSDFTSYGPTQTLAFKPDVAAPGGQIYSTYPLEKGGYATESGTSMASPHVAGLIALMLEARPTLKGNLERVRGLLQNNAVPAAFKGTPYLDAVHRQGAGMANVVKSILNPVYTEPSRLALGEVQGTVSKTVRLYNNGTKALTYKLSVAPAVGTYGTYPVEFSGEVPDVQLQYSTVTIYPGESFPVKVDITPAPDDRDGVVFGGYIVMTPSKGDVVRVPFMGYKGDLQALPAMTDNVMTMFDPETGNEFEQIDGAVFDFSKGQFPTLYFQMSYAAQQIVIDVLDGRTDKPIYDTGSEVYVENDLPRNQLLNPDRSPYYDFTWYGGAKKAQLKAGVAVTKTVKDGAYRLRLRALRAGGDPTNPEHWDTWISPLFYVKN